MVFQHLKSLTVIKLISLFVLLVSMQNISANIAELDSGLCLFRPVYFHTQGNVLYRIEDDSLSTEMFEGIQIVLQYYRVNFEKELNKIYVNCSLFADFDLLANYTSKSTDKEWLSNRRKLLKLTE